MEFKANNDPDRSRDKGMEKGMQAQALIHLSRELFHGEVGKIRAPSLSEPLPLLDKKPENLLRHNRLTSVNGIRIRS